MKIIHSKITNTTLALPVQILPHSSSGIILKAHGAQKTLFGAFGGYG